jgi:hypothetical protein
MAMQIWLGLTIDGVQVTSQVDVTTMPRAFQGEAPSGIDPDTLRLGLRISERVADFADSVRTS